MNEYKPNILIVEDDPRVMHLNSRLLARRGFRIATAESAMKARTLIAGQRFDLVILDINLPDGNGYDLCREFRSAGHKEISVIFLTGRSQIDDKVEGLEAGGDYYLVKPYNFDELFAVIQSQLRKTTLIRKQIAEAMTITRGPLVLQIPLSKAFVDGRDAELTPKEFAVLLLLVQNEDKELKSETIYQSVWGATMNNNTGTIRQHISRLKKKLGEEDTDDFYILNERGLGYIFTTR